MMVQIAVILIGVAILADQVEIALWEIRMDRRRAEMRRRALRNVR
jgi:hypothetical protein